MMAVMVLLFSYGTLRDKRVQIATFGRELKGRPNVLPGYTRHAVVVRGQRYANLRPGKLNDSVSGMAFEIAERELTAADRYEETAGYGRISVKLRSGDQAWVYVKR
jgi:gamma-glutamylcyclotransferase (GGCT)/AIG2-like uncharacterized protein YtfP